MKVSCIVAVCGQHGHWSTIVPQLINQTLEPFQILVMACCLEPQEVPRSVTIIPCDHEDDWGHSKRSRGLQEARGDVVGFFATDDLYSSKYLKKMTQKLGRADIVGCDFASHLVGVVAPTEPKEGQITMGSFLVRRKIAQQVGFNHRHYQADYQFIEDLMNAGAKFKRLPEVLYVHK